MVLRYLRIFGHLIAVSYCRYPRFFQHMRIKNYSIIKKVRFACSPLVDHYFATLSDTALGGLKPAPVSRLRGAHSHLQCSYARFKSTLVAHLQISQIRAGDITGIQPNPLQLNILCGFLNKKSVEFYHRTHFLIHRLNYTVVLYYILDSGNCVTKSKSL